MIVLVVSAHPDDECFLGGTIAKLAAQGRRVVVGTFTDGVGARGEVDGAWCARHRAHTEALLTLGVAHAYAERLPDQRLDSVDLLDLTQCIERWIAEEHPEVVYTHSPSDLNADHRRIYEATLPAVRPKSGVKAVYAYQTVRELPDRPFAPTHFEDITNYVDRKCAAMACYDDELAGEGELVKARAIQTGYVAGVEYAEGFEVIRVTQ